MDGLVSRFADNIKIGEVVDREEGCQRLQRGIDKLQIWAEMSYGV